MDKFLRIKIKISRLGPFNRQVHNAHKPEIHQIIEPSGPMPLRHSRQPNARLRLDLEIFEVHTSYGTVLSKSGGKFEKFPHSLLQKSVSRVHHDLSDLENTSHFHHFIISSFHHHASPHSNLDAIVAGWGCSRPTHPANPYKDICTI